MEVSYSAPFNSSIIWLVNEKVAVFGVHHELAMLAWYNLQQLDMDHQVQGITEDTCFKAGFDFTNYRQQALDQGYAPLTFTEFAVGYPKLFKQIFNF